MGVAVCERVGAKASAATPVRGDIALVICRRRWCLHS